MRLGQYVAVIFVLSIDVKGDVVNGSVRLKEGDPAAHLKDISKIKPGGKWTLEQNATVVLRRCSPEEERKGCKNFTSARFSVKAVNGEVFIVLHNVTNSDAGIYVFQVAGDQEEQFNVTVDKPTGRSETELANTSVTTILAICSSILAVLLLLLLCLYFMCKHKEKITIWFKGLREPHCDMSVQSSECKETSRDPVNNNHKNLQPLLLSDDKNH